MQKQQIAAIYCRLSKEDVDKVNAGDESESIQNQKLLLLDFATKNDFLVYKVYVDEDLSGFSDRPNFKQMIMDAAEGQFNIIVCKSQSRFTRDMELVEKYIHGLFVEWGVRFIGVTDNVDTNIKGNKKARQIYGLINEWYSEDLSENIRAVFRRKMEAGQHLGGFACYGYKKCPQDRHKLVVDEDAAEVVKEIYSLYLQGNGTHAIAHILTHKGVPTPTQHKKQQGLKYENPQAGVYIQKYGTWSSNSINRILRNEAYIGTLIQGRERKVSYKSKKVVIAPESDWVIVKNNHQPIIQESDFYKVQTLITRKRTGYKIETGSKPEKAKPHILAGKVLCADCGSTMQRSGLSRDGKTHYLRCRLSAKSKRRDCTPHCISQDKVEAAIIQRIRGLIGEVTSGDCADDIIKTSLARIKKEGDNSAKIEKQIFDLEIKIEAIRVNIARAYADKLNDIISEEDFVSFRAIFEQDRIGLANRKGHLESELVAIQIQKKTFGNIGVLLEKYKQIDVLTHEIINDFIDTIHISERDPDTKEQIIRIGWLF
ncbi:MAG: recombinase family protein [Defluviitaleaceae bacterium]|nr:recombinase family protein [Defluviitaleaceae bacterium]